MSINNEWKITVVGAGFAGLIAARELEALGHEVRVLEARDRIGGRTWTEERLGHSLEIGGTWVHWMMPYIWAEIIRYDETLVESPVPDRAYWVRDGELQSSSSEEFDERLGKLQDKIFEGSREFFPYPHEPRHIFDSDEYPEELRERMRAADATSIAEAVAAAGFTEEEAHLVQASWAAAYNGYLDNASTLMAKHWAALSDHRLSLVDEQTIQFKIAGGMRAVYEGIERDLNTAVELNTVVTRVEHDEDGATITTGDGKTHRADAVIITAPIGALREIEFSPELAESPRQTIREGLNSTGTKVWFKVRGHRSFAAYAPPTQALTLVRSEYFLEDDTTLFVGFGPDRDKIDVTDAQQVQDAVRFWLPDVEVVESTGHDWGADPYTQETWSTPRVGQFLRTWDDEFEIAERRLQFAGGDLAKGWNGFVDGAIESGMRAARALNSLAQASGSEANERERIGTQ